MSELLAGRYEVIRPLGTGGMADVLLVRDTREGRECALKRLHLTDPEAVARLREEFAALARIDHPNIVRVYDYGTLEDGAPYFTMEYLKGKPLDEALSPGDVPGVLRALRDILAGLAALHSAGLVHCDLKASNLFVVEGEGGATSTRILDFGLTGRLTEASGERVRGTPGYVAPEVLDGAKYSRESDYYALGATLYRVLTGRPAFPGRNASAVLTAQRTRRPSVLPLRTAGVPRALEVALLALLDSHPISRAPAIESLVSLVSERASKGARESDAPETPGRGSFVGRAPERRRLLHHLLRNGTHAAAISGPPGSGRTRLAREIAIEAELSEWSVHWLDMDVEVQGSWSNEPQSRGTLVVLEDADSWSSEALAALPFGDLAQPVAVVATVLGGNLRGPWRGSLLRLPTDPSWLDVDLDPLSDEDTAAIFRARGASPGQQELIEVSVAAVGRHPGALHRAIDALSLHEGLERSPDGWRLEPGLARQALDARLASDPDEWNAILPASREVALGLAGWPESLSLSAIAQWSNQSVASVEGAIRDLEWLGWTERSTTGWRIVPRSRADWILDHGSGTAIRSRMTSALQGQVTALRGGDQTARSHWMAILGRHEVALGQKQQGVHTLREAIRIGETWPSGPYLRLAAVCLEQANPSDGVEAANTFAELGAFWERLDSPGAAIECYGKAIAALPDSEWLKAAEWTFEQASLLEDLGRYSEALIVLERFSTSFGPPDPTIETSREQAIALSRLAAIRGRSLQMQGQGATAREAYEDAMSGLPKDAHGELAVIQNRLGMMRYLSGSTVDGLNLIEEAAINAATYGDPDIIARVFHAQALCARYEGREEDEDRFLAQSIALRRALPRRERYVKLLATRTTVLSNRALWREFDELATEVESLARESQNTVLLLQVMASRATGAMRRGRIEQQRHIERVELAWLGSVTHAEARLHHMAHRGQRLLLEGKESAARKLFRTLLRRSRSEALPTYERYAQVGLGSISLRSGDLTAARDQFARVMHDFRTETFLLYSGIVGMARIARRERDRDRVLELIGLLDDHPKPPLWWGPLRAELVGIRSLIDGRVPDAVAGFNEALSHFSKAELRPHEMETAWEAGVALAEANEPAHAHAFLRRAHEVAQTLGLEIPAGRLADIVLHLTLGAEATALPAAGEEPDTLVRVATVLNSLLDFPVLLTQSLELVCTRVGAERGFILLTDGENESLRSVAQFGGVDDSSRDKALEVSRTVVRQVTESGNAFRSPDASNDPRLGSTLSILDMSVRALLCTPLRLKDKVIGTIYVENRDAIRQFSDQDTALVDAFGNLVAVTIQNSRLHEELRRSRDRVIGQNLSLRREVGARYSRPNIVGQSAEIERVLGEIERVAQSRGSVLITGESGTGKELVAKTIHFASPRVDRPFLSLNCAALPADLIESELFGIEDHVATGVRGRPGIFERADGGTLFLDEIGDMPLSLQAKLLRVLQEREFTRLGGARVVHVDIRLIAATNQDLRQLIREGRFREDLYFRVHTLPIHIVPLRERKVDIPILANHFLHRFCEENGLPVPRISADFTATIMSHAWPGNVRELQNYIERSVVMSRGPILEPVVLPTEEDPGGALLARNAPKPLGEDFLAAGSKSLKEALEEAERRWILQTLEQFNGNQRQAARSLGVVEPTLRYRMSRLGIKGAPKAASPNSRRSKH